MTLFLSKLEPTMVSFEPHPRADGSRTVTVWTWPEGPNPVQGKPFEVRSLEEARAMIPGQALRVMSAPEWFAEEVWMTKGETP
jgi:hypothetical protein